MEVVMKKSFVLTFIFTLMSGGLVGLMAEEAAGPWTASVGFGLTKTSGNSDITSLALTFQAVREMDRAKWGTNANVTYATTEGDETANKGGVKTQYDYFYTDLLFFFGKVGFEFDKFAELDLRTSPGAGIGYILVQDEGIKLSGSVGANAVTDFFSNDTKDSRGTLSFSEEFSYDLTATSSLFQNLNIQNNFEDFGDYLLDAEISLSTKISDQFSLKASLLNKYDADPFSEDLKKNDITFITSINYTL
jgi:putative salt-induced outer membrane protein YdiY